MTPPVEPREIEAVPVTLMVGGAAKDIANLAEKVLDLRTDEREHRDQIDDLQSEMQQVKSDQAGAARDLKAADKARDDTAAALEKQTADMVAKAKAAVDQSTQRWTPAMRLYATIGALAALAAIVLGVVSLVWGP
jgi:chromosome segregation ATPase